LPVCVYLSVFLLARLLTNACMDLDQMLHVDRCRDIDELIFLTFEPDLDHSPHPGTRFAPNFCMSAGYLKKLWTYMKKLWTN